MAGLFVDQLLIYLLLIALKFARGARTLMWPVVNARTIGSMCERPNFGCYIARIHYEYWIDERRYKGIHHEPFLRYSSGWRYARANESGADLQVRVKRGNPRKSVAIG